MLKGALAEGDAGLSVKPFHLLFQALACTEDQVFAQQYARYGAERVKSLRDVKPQSGILLRSHEGAEGVGRGLQEA